MQCLSGWTVLLPHDKMVLTMWGGGGGLGPFFLTGVGVGGGWIGGVFA